MPAGPALCDAGVRGVLNPATMVVATDGLYPNRVAITWADTDTLDAVFKVMRGGTLLTSVSVTYTRPKTPKTDFRYEDATGVLGTVYSYCIVRSVGGTDAVPVCDNGAFGTLAFTVLVAMGEEPRVAATWEDSSFADIQVALDAELGRFGVPEFFEPAGVLMGKLLSGDDIASRSPLAAIAKLDGRPIFITHGDQDKRLSVQYAIDLANAVRASGGTVDPWIVPGSDHIMAMYDHTADYEQKLLAFFEQQLK